MLEDDLVARAEELASLHGPAGRENEVLQALARRFEPAVDDVRRDPFGNLYAVRHGPPEARRVMISTHADEVGLMVRRVDERGFLRFERLGSPTPELLPGRRVQVGGQLGVIGARSDHLRGRGERGPAGDDDVSRLYIDVGAGSRAEVEALGIHPGTPVTLVSDLARMGTSHRYSGKAVDDRLGCAVLALLVERLADRELPVTLGSVVTVQEEVGMRGAEVAAYRFEPDVALVLDVTVCDDTPDQSRQGEATIALGGGPVIHVLEQSRTSNLGMLPHPAVADALVATAKRLELPFQRAMLYGGHTDAAVVHRSRGGVPSCFVGIPCRYTHSPVETFDAGDAAATLRLVEGFVTDEAAKLDL